MPRSGHTASTPAGDPVSATASAPAAAAAAHVVRAVYPIIDLSFHTEPHRIGSHCPRRATLHRTAPHRLHHSAHHTTPHLDHTVQRNTYRMAPCVTPPHRRSSPLPTATYHSTRARPCTCVVPRPPHHAPHRTTRPLMHPFMYVHMHDWYTHARQSSCERVALARAA